MLARSIRLTLLLAATAIFLISADYVPWNGKEYMIPGSPLSPTTPQACQRLAMEFDQLSSLLTDRHEQCLAAQQAQKQPSNPNSGSGPGSACSFAACQWLHTTRYSMADKGKKEVAACEVKLHAYEAEQKQLAEEKRQRDEILRKQREELTRQAAAEKEALAKLAEKQKQQADAERQRVQQENALRAQKIQEEAKRVQDVQDATQKAREAEQKRTQEAFDTAKAGLDAAERKNKEAGQAILDLLKQNAVDVSPAADTVPSNGNTADVSVTDPAASDSSSKPDVAAAANYPAPPPEALLDNPRAQEMAKRSAEISDLQAIRKDVVESGNVDLPSWLKSVLPDALIPQNATIAEAAGVLTGVKGASDIGVSALTVPLGPEGKEIKTFYEAAQGGIEAVKANGELEQAAAQSKASAAGIEALAGGTPLARTASTLANSINTASKMEEDDPNRNRKVLSVGNAAAATVASAVDSDVGGAVTGVVDGAITIHKGIEIFNSSQEIKQRNATSQELLLLKIDRLIQEAQTKYQEAQLIEIQEMILRKVRP